MSDNVTEEEMADVMGLIDEDTAMGVDELSDETGYTIDSIQKILEALMERGKITSTPDWKYRQSRRVK